MTEAEFKARVQRTMHELQLCMQSAQYEDKGPGFPSPIELETIKEELQRIRAELETGTLPPDADDRTTIIGRIITDTWWNCDKDLLAELLLSVTEGYRTVDAAQRKSRDDR